MILPSRTTRFFDPPLPRIFAHRGLAIDAPENTILAFAHALSTGATHIETDVQVSRDGVAIISHDRDLSRVASRDVRIDQLTRAELSAIDLGHGQSYCSLVEALNEFPDARFNIDVKVDAAVGPATKAIMDANATDRVLVASFSEKRRRRVMKKLPAAVSSASVSLVAQALIGHRTHVRRLLRRVAGRVDAVQLPERYRTLPLISERSVEAFHSVGLEVHVWTINDQHDMRRLLGLGVDGIVTDRADLARTVISSRS